MLLETTFHGLYCPLGGFFIDPWRPVDRAIITHAHADHARPGHRQYLTSDEGQHVLRTRIGPNASIETVRYGQPLRMGEVTVSLHPAGHILGSSQVRIEHRGEIVVVSGDYKRHADPTCTPFEPIRCHTFVTECTFGLPVYRWPDPKIVDNQINRWWATNQANGDASVVYGYALGKAQRILACLDPSIGPIVVHGAVEKLNESYRATGVGIPEILTVSQLPDNFEPHKAIVIAPPSAHGTPWLKRFGSLRTAMASGWMRIRGGRRRRAMDRGFVISDHIDWPDLMRTIKETEAERILATHGNVSTVVRYLREQGLDAHPLATEFRGESLDESDDALTSATSDNNETHSGDTPL